MLHRDVEAVAARVFEDEVLAASGGVGLLGPRARAGEAPDAVVDVDDVRAGRQFLDGRRLETLRVPPGAGDALLPRAEDLRVRQQGDERLAALLLRERPSARDGRVHDGDALPRRGVQRPLLRRAHVGLGEQLPQALGVLRRDHDRAAMSGLDGAGQVLDGAVVRRRGFERQRQRGAAGLRPSVAAEFQPGKGPEHPGDGVPVGERRGEPHGQRPALLLRKAHLLRAALHVPGGLAGLGGLVHHDDDVVRQVVEQGVAQQEAGVERGVVHRHPGEEVGQFVLDAVALGRSGVREVEAAYEGVDPLVVGEQGKRLTGGKHRNRVQMLARSLGVGVERADGVDLVAPEVYAHGAVVPRPVDVDDAASPRHGAGMVHERADGIAHARPAGQHGLYREALSARDRVHRAAQHGGGERLLQDAGHRCDDERGRAVGPVQRAEGADALVHGSRFDGEPLVGEHLRFGEVQQRGVLAAVRLQLVEQPPRVVRVGAERQHRTPEVAPQPRDHERLGRVRRNGGMNAAGRHRLGRAPVGLRPPQHVDQSGETQETLRRHRDRRRQAPHAHTRGTRLPPVRSGTVESNRPRCLVDGAGACR